MPTPSKTKRASSKEVEAALSGSTEPQESEAKSLAGFPITSADGMDQYINFLVYGEPGTGKTVLLGSASVVPQMSPMLIIDVEGGTMPLRAMYPKVDVVRVKSFKELQRVYNELYKGDHPYKTVGLDSLTEMQKMSMQGIMRAAKAQNPDLSEETPRIQDWGTNLYQTRAMIRGFRDLPMNVLFTALNDEGEKNGISTNRPLFQGKLKSEGPGFVDIVAYYYMKRTKDADQRLLLTQATNTTMAKDRSTLLPKVMENPTMGDIYSAILGTAA